MTHLFSPLTLRQLQIPNRVWLSPMCQYSATEGLANTWHLVHLGSRAVGGAGLVIVEATAVTPAGRITHGDLGLWNEAQVAALQPITAFIKAQGAIPAIQLAHAGRKASTDLPWQGGAPIPPTQPLGWQPVAPSALPFEPRSTIPTAMDKAALAATIAAFVAAAQRARQAGFDVVELHMAHGYLLHSFLSPLTNQRTDVYGGSLENRMRLPLQVAAAVRAVWPQDLPLFVRLSVSDWVAGGWDLAQSITLSQELKALGVDLIDCSSGGLMPDAVIPAAPDYQVPFATAIREQVGIPTAAVGLITEPAQAAAILSGDKADAVLLGRAALRDPYWPLHAAKFLQHELDWPAQYRRGKPN